MLDRGKEGALRRRRQKTMLMRWKKRKRSWRTAKVGGKCNSAKVGQTLLSSCFLASRAQSAALCHSIGPAPPPPRTRPGRTRITGEPSNREPAHWDLLLVGWASNNLWKVSLIIISMRRLTVESFDDNTFECLMLYSFCRALENYASGRVVKLECCRINLRARAAGIARNFLASSASFATSSVNSSAAMHFFAIKQRAGIRAAAPEPWREP